MIPFSIIYLTHIFCTISFFLCSAFLFVCYSVSNRILCVDAVWRFSFLIICVIFFIFSVISIDFEQKPGKKRMPLDCMCVLVPLLCLLCDVQYLNIRMMKHEKEIHEQNTNFNFFVSFSLRFFLYSQNYQINAFSAVSIQFFLITKTCINTTFY